MSFQFNPGQLRGTSMLVRPQRHTMLAGGARSGKTFLLMRAVLTRALRAEKSRHAVLRFRGNAARSSIALDTLPKVRDLCFPGLEIIEKRQDGYYLLPNGAEIWIGGLDDKIRAEKILGQEFATIYLNECSQIPYSSVLLARTRLAQMIEGLPQRMYYDLNPGGKSHWSFLEFIEGLDPVSKEALRDPEQYEFMYLNPAENAANLSPEYLQSLQNMPSRQRKRFYDGEYVTEIDGALWTLETLARCRIDLARAPTYTPAYCRKAATELGVTEIVVGVDPSGASGDEDTRSDEIGIVAVGRIPYGNQIVVLEDATMRGGPAEWAKVTRDVHDRWKASRVVAEKNYGGGMVEATLAAQGRGMKIEMVTASRGKHVRAEPVSTLYEDGPNGEPRARHLGTMPELEDQMTNFSVSGYQGAKSPDRADAMIWAATSLMENSGYNMGALT